MKFMVESKEQIVLTSEYTGKTMGYPLWSLLRDDNGIVRVEYFEADDEPNDYGGVAYMDKTAEVHGEYAVCRLKYIADNNPRWTFPVMCG
jgi:hypothetical protein